MRGLMLITIGDGIVGVVAGVEYKLGGSLASGIIVCELVFGETVVPRMGFQGLAALVEEVVFARDEGREIGNEGVGQRIVRVGVVYSPKMLNVLVAEKR